MASGLLNGKLEFAFPNDISVLNDGAAAVLLRAEISSKGRDVEIDTITMLDGTATPSHEFVNLEDAESKASPNLNANYHNVCKDLIYLLVVESVLLFLATLQGNISPSVSLFIGIGLLPATALALDFFSGSRRNGGGWEWVVINGWQSFSYAGVLSTAGCRTALGAVQHLLWMLRLLPSLQPRVQTGWAFSGAFHDGPCLAHKAPISRNRH